jgi:DNA-binding GntR family transcriptional regulator
MHPIIYSDLLTETQRITLAVLLAARNVERQQFEELDAHAQQLRDAVDVGDYTEVK